MPPDASPVTSEVVTLDELLLRGKLSVPPQRPSVVSRSALIDRARTSGCRVVSVTAPAGYGKSTMLAEWASVEDRQVAWVSLDRFDDDPAVLVVVLASAIAGISPEFDGLPDAVGGGGASVLGRAAPRLAGALRSSAVPFVVMLDDFHELKAPGCRDVMDLVMAGIPGGSQLIVAGRSDQHHLPRLRAEGHVFELGPTDLVLDGAGVERIFADADVSVTSAIADVVAARTEGWPVGIRLAALIASEPSADPVAITGADRYVGDYLYRELLSQRSEGEQRFLRWTAVLDELSEPLCNVVVDESSGEQVLRSMEASGSFLVPLDRRREWFRYHALFREFLLGELRRTEPDMIAKLHMRAADWYQANGSPVRAIEHLLNTSETTRCAHLVATLVLPTYKAGQISTLQRWLSTLGEPAIQDYPPLAVVAVWIAALTGNTTEAQRWAAFVESAPFEQTPLDGSVSYDSGRAMARALLCASGPERMQADAMFAVDHEPAWSPWRESALCLAGEAHLLTGDVETATQLFVESSTVSAPKSNTDALVISQAELALLAMEREDWSAATAYLDRSMSAIEEHQMQDYATCVLAFVAAGRLELRRGHLELATTHMTAAMRGRMSLTYALPYLAVRVRLQLAKLHWAIGEQGATRHLIREIDDILVRRPALGVLTDELAVFRKAISSSAHIATVSATPLSPAELRLLPYLQTHLTMAEIAGRLFVSRNTVNSQISSIYRKLAVSSRAEAVDRATVIGLLGG